jgi:hypothetical protein
MGASVSVKAKIFKKNESDKSKGSVTYANMKEGHMKLR